MKILFYWCRKIQELRINDNIGNILEEEVLVNFRGYINNDSSESVTEYRDKSSAI